MKKFELKYFSGLAFGLILFGIMAVCTCGNAALAQNADATKPAETAPSANAQAVKSGSINLNAAKITPDTVLPPVDDPLLKPAALPTAPSAPAAPARAPTKEEIAKEIAPNFDVNKDYNRLVQCYGTLDFTSAFMQVRASKPGAAPQLKGLAAQLDGLKKGMQPFVLATSTLKSEAKFRADYSAVSSKTQNQFFAAKNPDAFMQSKLQMANACQQDARGWAGVKK